MSVFCDKNKLGSAEYIYKQNVITIKYERFCENLLLPILNYTIAFKVQISYF